MSEAAEVRVTYLQVQVRFPSASPEYPHPSGTSVFSLFKSNLDFPQLLLLNCILCLLLLMFDRVLIPKTVFKYR